MLFVLVGTLVPISPLLMRAAGLAPPRLTAFLDGHHCNEQGDDGIEPPRPDQGIPEQPQQKSPSNLGTE
jgi:hypothetical protein